jgi:CBS domain-containing protein
MRARDIMTKEVITVTPETSVEEIAFLLLKYNISGVPVVERDKVVGVVSEADLLYKKKLPTSLVYIYQHGSYLKPNELAEEDKKIRATKAKEVMTREVISVSPETKVTEIVSIMEEKGIKRVLVMEGDKLVGIVSKLDVLRCLTGSCEELAQHIISKVNKIPTTVNDIMSCKVVTVKASDSVEDAARLLLEHRISGLPVVDEDGNLVGVLSESDLIHKAEPLPSPSLYYGNREKFLEEMWKVKASQVREVMTEDVITVSPEDGVEKAASLMLEKGVKRLPVVRGEKVVGMVTRADILKALARNFLS